MKRKHLRRGIAVVSGLLLILAIAGFMLPIASRPTLQLAHYERGKDAATGIALLRFTNHAPDSVLLSFHLAGGDLYPMYVVRSPDTGDQVVDGSTPEGFSIIHGTQIQVNPGETVPIKIPVRRGASAFYAGLRYRCQDTPTPRKSIYRLRWHLARWFRGWLGGFPAYSTSQETVWCATRLIAPADETDYSPPSPEWPYRPNMKWYVPREQKGLGQPVGPANGSQPSRPDSNRTPVAAGSRR